jgi:ABC-type microcin C transport system permease subunit YejB
MASISIRHWMMLIIIVASLVLGIVRGVRNSAPAHAVISVLVPAYGLVYFFAG